MSIVTLNLKPHKTYLNCKKLAIAPHKELVVVKGLLERDVKFSVNKEHRFLIDLFGVNCNHNY